MSIKVLYIEDNFDNMFIIRKMTQVMGHTFLGAFDGLSGIEIAARELPDIILLDINLPDIDGYAVVRKLKEMPQLAHTPVVALTADWTAREACLTAGCDGYLNKPISSASLLRTVKQLTHHLLADV